MWMCVKLNKQNTAKQFDLLSKLGRLQDVV